MLFLKIQFHKILAKTLSNFPKENQKTTVSSKPNSNSTMTLTINGFLIFIIFNSYLTIKLRNLYLALLPYDLNDIFS